LAGCANEFAGVSQPINIGNITEIKTLREREIKVFILSVSYFLLFGPNEKMKSHQSLTTPPYQGDQSLTVDHRLSTNIPNAT
jgi:hypothetical protein